jgi:hypothetical protein
MPDLCVPDVRQAEMEHHMSWGHDGVSTHPQLTRKTDHATRLRIAERYEDGESMAQLGRDYGLHVLTVKQILRDQGVELRPDPRRGKPFGGAW